MNNLTTARFARYAYYISPARRVEFNDGAFLGFEENLQNAFSEWSRRTKNANFYLFTKQGYFSSWAEDV